MSNVFMMQTSLSVAFLFSFPLAPSSPRGLTWCLLSTLPPRIESSHCFVPFHHPLDHNNTITESVSRSRFASPARLPHL
ncbi:hypothetical protein OF83DRAFT_661535 [Amylostereum chailletii]|nr:hypothetical protein OF83DRAFT_661535 [Amylostereum chailletii]